MIYKGNCDLGFLPLSYLLENLTALTRYTLILEIEETGPRVSITSSMSPTW